MYYTNHHWFPLFRCLRAMTLSLPDLPPHISRSSKRWTINSRRCLHIFLRSIADRNNAVVLPLPRRQKTIADLTFALRRSQDGRKGAEVGPSGYCFSVRQLCVGLDRRTAWAVQKNLRRQKDARFHGMNHHPAEANSSAADRPDLRHRRCTVRRGDEGRQTSKKKTTGWCLCRLLTHVPNGALSVRCVISHLLTLLPTRFAVSDRRYCARLLRDFATSWVATAESTASYRRGGSARGTLPPCELPVPRRCGLQFVECPVRFSAGVRDASVARKTRRTTRALLLYTRSLASAKTTHDSRTFSLDISPLRHTPRDCSPLRQIPSPPRIVRLLRRKFANWH